MNGNNLGDEIKVALDAIKPAEADAVDVDYVRAIANAIVNHITTNGKATPGTFAAGGDPVTGKGGIE